MRVTKTLRKDITTSEDGSPPKRVELGEMGKNFVDTQNHDG